MSSCDKISHNVRMLLFIAYASTAVMELSSGVDPSFFVTRCLLCCSSVSAMVGGVYRVWSEERVSGCQRLQVKHRALLPHINLIKQGSLVEW